MKKAFVIIFGLSTFLGYSQKGGNNEIKLNLPYMIAGLPEVSYERIIDDNAAAGISFAFSLESVNNMTTRFMVTPYYRLYFGKEKAKGFFIEANAAVVGQKDYVYDNFSGSYTTDTVSTTNFGLGAAVGAKFLNKNGYIGELYGGLGRVFGINDTDMFSDLYPRLGISIGKRF